MSLNSTIEDGVVKSMGTPTPIKRTKGGSSHVRFTPEEYAKITTDAKLAGESIPDMLKAAYFHGPSRIPLMRPDDVKTVMAELGRIGNNVNQVARHLNSGFRAGFNDDLDEINRSFKRLADMVTLTYSPTSREAR